MAKQPEGAGITWTNETWNPIRGCSRISEGCRHCYAESQAGRWCGPGEPYEGLAKRVSVTNGIPAYGFPQVKSESRWTGEVRFIEEHLADPLRWRKPKRIFVNSMSDLFHEKVELEWIRRIFGVMAECPQHTFQILTKRAERMLQIVPNLYPIIIREERDRLCESPLNNVWLGVSVEDQQTADERIPLLLESPAAIRWISYEPALAPVEFTHVDFADIDYNYKDVLREWVTPAGVTIPRGIDWIVIGGESGPGARPFNIQWARDVIAQCKTAGVPVFCKQLGAYVISRNDTGFEGDTPRSWPMGTCIEDETHEVYQGAPVRVRLKDRKGGDWSEWPNDLRIRQFPGLER